MYLWDGVTEFVAVAEKGSFTAAGKFLGISTAQVSRQVNALEERLHTKLFYRTTRKVVLTEEGQIYYRHCRQVLTGLEEAERAISDRRGAPQGTIKLTAPVYYGERYVLPLVHDFMMQYPEVEVVSVLTNRALDLVEGGYDLAIRLGRLADSSMMAKRLANRTQYVCASPAYITRFGMPQTAKELSSHQCLTGTHDIWRFIVDGSAYAVKVSGKIRCNSGQALLDAAIKGLGIVQLPDYYVAEPLKTGRLVELLSAEKEPEEGVWAMYPHNRHLSPKIRLLVEHLESGLGDENLLAGLETQSR